jgi:hypothetical protein
VLQECNRVVQLIPPIVLGAAIHQAEENGTILIELHIEVPLAVSVPLGLEMTVRR